MVTVATGQQGQSKQWRLRLRNYKHHGSFCAKSSICHVHLHDLSHATAIVFMITDLALIFYGPPWRSSSCHVHWTPVNIAIIFRLPIFIFIFILHLCAHAHCGCTITITTVRCHVRCSVWPRSLCLATFNVSGRSSSSRPVRCLF